MNFKIEKSDLQKIVGASARVTAKSAIPALEGILLVAEPGFPGNVRATGYNLKTGITAAADADVGEAGGVVIEARLLTNMLRAMPDDDVSVVSDADNNVTVKCGKSTYKIKGLSATDYPELPSDGHGKTLSIPQKTIKSMISETVFACSTSETRPVHMGAQFKCEAATNKLSVAAVDGFRLAIRREQLADQITEDFSFVVSSQALKEIDKACVETEEKVIFDVGPKIVKITVNDISIFSRLLEGSFLDYEKALPKTFAGEATVKTESVKKLFERCAIVAGEKSPVLCDFSDHYLTAAAASAVGNVSDSCSYDGEMADLHIGLNSHYILDVFSAIKQATVKVRLNNATTPAIICPVDDDDSFTYMVLPIRVKAN